MLTIALRQDLADRLQTEAERRQTSVETLANEWLEQQLWEEQHRKIHEESRRYQAQHAELLKRYAGQYIAMRDGVVLDHDADVATLHRRVRAQYGDAPILMTLVTTEPIRTFKMISNRFLSRNQ